MTGAALALTTILAGLSPIQERPQLAANVTVTLHSRRSDDAVRDRNAPIAVRSEYLEPDESGRTRVRLFVRQKKPVDGQLFVGEPITDGKDLDLRYFTEVDTIVAPDIELKNSKGEIETVSDPTGIAIDRRGTLYISEFGGATRIMAYRNGIVDPIAQFKGPQALEVNNEHLYVLDVSAGCLYRIPLGGGPTEYMAGNGRINSSLNAPARDGVGPEARFGVLHDIAFLNGMAIINEFHSPNHFRKVTDLIPNRTRVISVPVDMPVLGPNLDTMTINGSRFILVAWQNQIFFIDPNTHEFRALFGSKTIGYRDGDGATGRFNYPQCFHVSNNAIYIQEGKLHVVRQITLDNPEFPFAPSSWTVKTIAGTGKKGRDDGPGYETTLGSGIFMVSDNKKTLYMTEPEHKTVRRIRIKGEGSWPLGRQEDMVKIEASQPLGADVSGGKRYEIAKSKEEFVVELTLSKKEPVLSFQLPISFLKKTE